MSNDAHISLKVTLDGSEVKTGVDEVKSQLGALDKLAEARATLNIQQHSQIAAQIDKVKAAYDTLAESGTLTGLELVEASVAMHERVAELEDGTGN